MSESKRLKQAIAAHHEGNFLKAENVYQQLLSEDANDTEVLNAYGILNLQRGKLPAAMSCFDKAVKLDPEVAKFHNNIGNVRMAENAFVAAIEAFGRAVQIEPDSAEFLANLATAQMLSGDSAGAKKEFKNALSIDPDHFRSRHNLGSLLSKESRYQDALEHLQHAAQHPDCEIDTVLNLTSTYEHLNRLNEASSCLRSLKDTSNPMAQILTARLMRRQGDPVGALDYLRARDAISTERWSDLTTGDWYHELALSGDLAGDTEMVFEHCINAKNYWRRADGNQDGRDYLDGVRHIRQWASTRSNSASKNAAPKDMPPLIFFVGFPRSGTTILETMLDAHPNVLTTGEANLLAPLLDKVGRPTMAMPHLSYLSAFSQLFGPIDQTKTIVDKFPLNLIFCHAIQQIFPDAQLLVALRDPRDVVLSCLMQRFHRSDAMRNFDTLESTAILYQEVMGLWLEARKNLNISWLEYRYEDFVSNQDATVDRILQFVGVGRHSAMRQYREKAATREVKTPSYRDVTLPVYRRAVERWRNYEDKLEPVLDRLTPFIEAFGYNDHYTKNSDGE